MEYRRNLFSNIDGSAAWLTPKKFDDFLIALGKFVNAKELLNIEFVSSRFSFDLSNKIEIKKYFLLKNEKYPEILLIPVIVKKRFVLTVFYLQNQKVAYFDSLKDIEPEDFITIKNRVETELELNFEEMSQNKINSNINDNFNLDLADFHICRIAEEICFNNGKNKLLRPFLIDAEIQRMKNIFTLISDPNWNLQWLPTIQFREAKFYFRPGSECSILLDKSFNLDTLNPTCFVMTYPILSTFLLQYLHFYKFLKSFQNTIPQRQTIFDWAYFKQIQKVSFEESTKLIRNFSFIQTLSQNDKNTLFQHFEIPFLLFERVFYTFLSTSKKNFIILYNGNFINLFSIEHENVFPVSLETEKAQKTFFLYLKKIMDKIIKFDLHLIEGMYIFFTLLWNIQYLDDPISKEGEAVVRRGRFLLNSEMQKFYGNDRIKCQRLFHLKDICQIIEDGGKACKNF